MPTPQPSPSALDLIFEEPEITENLIKKVDIQIKKDGPCETMANGAKKHTAASAKLPNIVCFSVSELKKYKVSSVEEGEMMILALFYHELAHLLGANEELAEAIQSEIQASPLRDFKADPGYIEYINKNLISFLDLVSSDSAPDTELCGNLSLLREEVRDFERLAFRGKEKWASDRANNRIDYATFGFCQMFREFPENVFKDDRSLSDAEFHKRRLEYEYSVHGNGSPAHPGYFTEIKRLASDDVVIKRVFPGDRQTLVTEIETAVAEWRQALSSLIQQMKK